MYYKKILLAYIGENNTVYYDLVSAFHDASGGTWERYRGDADLEERLSSSSTIGIL